MIENTSLQNHQRSTASSFYKKNTFKAPPKQSKLQTVKSAEHLLPEPQQIRHQFNQLKKLTVEKDNLIKELNLLKQGAVTALLQKQEQIQKLKHHTQRSYDFEDQKEQMQKQLNKLTRQVKDLEEENIELVNQKEKDRKFFFQELYSKQQLIDQHLSSIQKLENKIFSLEKQLQEKQKAYHNLEIEVQTIKLEFINFKMERNSSPSPVSIDKIYNYELQEELHKKQIQQLIVFYENRVNVIQNLYEREFNLKKTMQTQQYSQQGQDKDSVCQLASHKSFFQPQLINLKSDILKNLQNTWKTDDFSDSQSRFTNKYFDYYGRNKRSPLKLDTAFKAIKCEQNYEIKSNKEIDQDLVLNLCTKCENKAGNKDNLIFAGCGFAVGALTTHIIRKIIA